MKTVEQAAQDAKSTASTANSTAEAARSTAEQAQSKANDAAGSAQRAQNTANSAIEATDNNKNRIDSMESDVSSLKNSCSAAQSKANDAAQAASKAQSVADSANSAAQAAASKADSAQQAVNNMHMPIVKPQSLTGYTTPSSWDWTLTDLKELPHGGHILIYPQADGIKEYMRQQPEFEIEEQNGVRTGKITVITHQKNDNGSALKLVFVWFAD